MPITTHLPVVVTLHDATFFTEPGVHTRVKRRFFRFWTRVALRRAAECIVPSAATRDELVRVVDRRAERCIVAHHGVDPREFHPPTAAALDRARLMAGSPRWVTFLGTIEPRKNVANLIKGFAAARRGDPDLALLLVGAKGWDTEIDRLVSETGTTVRRLGYVDKEDLPGLLGGAETVAYPSLGEGFGLPVLEAMACGAAVLTTRRLALPEVAGNAAEYCEPDAASIAASLAKLFDHPSLRAELRRRGRARATEFTWDRAAAIHQEAYLAAQRGTL
jgi:glycosyltransferase involved in cell wall biosynthesis